MQYIHELPLYSKRHYCSFEATHQRTLVREFFLRVPLLSKGKMLYVTNCTVLLHQCNHGKKYYNQNIENIVTFSSLTQYLKIAQNVSFFTTLRAKRATLISKLKLNSNFKLRLFYDFSTPNNSGRLGHFL